jgi:hypothetical protein
VVGQGDDAGGFKQFVFMLADDFGTHDRVLVHDLPFLGIELARLEQDGIGDADLADVVHRRRVEDDAGRFVAQPVGEGNQAGVMAHAQDVVAGLVVLEFGGPAKAADDLLAGGQQFQRALLDHALQFARLVVEGEVGAHPRLDDGRADRFGDVVDGAGLQAALFVFGAAHRGDEDDRDASPIRIGFETPADFQTADPRHHDVEQDQVGRFVGIDDLQRLFAGGGHPDPVFVAKHFREQVDVFRIVVDNQDALFGEQG